VPFNFIGRVQDVIVHLSYCVAENCVHSFFLYVYNTIRVDGEGAKGSSTARILSWS
jgi:hypothetical protein